MFTCMDFSEAVPKSLAMYLLLRILWISLILYDTLHKLVFNDITAIVSSIAYRNVIPSFYCTKIANEGIKIVYFV